MSADRAASTDAAAGPEFDPNAGASGAPAGGGPGGPGGLGGLGAPLVDVETLAALLGVSVGDRQREGRPAPGRVQVLDVRWTLGGPPGLDGFRAGHVPGARYADLETVFARPPAAPVDGRGRHPLPDPADLAADLADLGITGEVPVVLVDAGSAMAAARAWWVLRWAGVPAGSVAVLDGGQAAWEAAGLPVETGAGGGPTATSGHDDVAAAVRRSGRPAAWSLDLGGGHLPTVDADGAALAGQLGRLVDARAPERWRGDVEPVDPRAGHVPGARNLPWDGDLGPDGRWLSAGALADRLRSAGLGGTGPDGGQDSRQDSGQDPGVVSCGSGVSAAHLVLAAAVAGLPLPALYPGSFSGWVADASRPVETV